MKGVYKRIQYMEISLRTIGTPLIALLLAGAVIWGALALWFMLPGDGARIFFIVGYAVLGVLGLVIGAVRRKLILALLPFAIAFGALLVWWSGVEPSNDRDWQQGFQRQKSKALLLPSEISATSAIKAKLSIRRAGWRTRTICNSSIHSI